MKELDSNDGRKINLDTLNISVIITAYNRKNYIRNAIESVIKQETDASRYELIIVSNYKLETDQFSTKIPIFNIVMEGNVGEFLYAGIRKAKYDLIAFLDDDDEFESKKLDGILSLFQNDDKLVYYHNSLNYINDNGDPMNYNRMVESRIQRRRLKTVIFNSSEEIEKLELALKQNADFNLSCIVIRKNYLEPYKKILKSIDSNQDDFFFWTGLISGGNIMVHTERLTKYRVHAMNVTKSATLEGKAIEIKKQIKTFALILVYIDKSEEPIVNKILIKKWIEMMKLEYEMNHAIFSKVRRRELLKKVKVLCRSGRRLANTLKYRLLFFSSVYLLSPSIGIFIYEKLSR